MKKEINCFYFKIIRKNGFPIYYSCTRLGNMVNGHWGRCRLAGNFRHCPFYQKREPWYVRLFDWLMKIF